MKLTEIESNVLAVALDHMQEHLQSFYAEDFESAQELEYHNKRVGAVLALQSKVKSKVKTYYIK